VSDFVMNEDQEPLERRADELRSELLKKEPEQLAALTETELIDTDHNRLFRFSFWGKPVELSCQDYIARDQESQGILPPIHQAMILYYFFSSKGSTQPGKWISFSELADGKFYNAAFQGYTYKKLLQFFNDDYEGFNLANHNLCGEKTSFGDGAYRYQVLPKVAMLIAYWEGDEDFPPSYKILFEDIVDYHLPTDACAILASMLTGKLIAEAS
jgi:hypothetical protein